MRGGLRVLIGKGTPDDIAQEAKIIGMREHTDIQKFSDEELKRFLMDHRIGIDCSGFAYYVLNAESEELGKGGLDKHLSFVQSRGLFGKIMSSLRPVRNAGVITFEDDKNSAAIPLFGIVSAPVRRFPPWWA